MSLILRLEAGARRSADAVARAWRSGEISAAKDGIGVYKAPLCFAVDGQHELANAVLDDIQKTIQVSPGEFCPPPATSVSPNVLVNLMSEYRTYFNAVILAGAAAVQRWDVCSEQAIAELLSRQHASGGFMKCKDDPNPLMPLSITCMVGFVLLARGRIAEAKRAGDFVARAVAANGDPAAATKFYFVADGKGGVVRSKTGYLTDHCLFTIDLANPTNRFYHLGISAAFLAELHSVSRDPTHLEYAGKALEFAERLHPRATQCAHVCKVAWGAALLYRETGAARWHALATRVAEEWFLGNQKSDGLCAGGPCEPCPHSLPPSPQPLFGRTARRGGAAHQRRALADDGVALAPTGTTSWSPSSPTLTPSTRRAARARRHRTSSRPSSRTRCTSWRAGSLSLDSTRRGCRARSHFSGAAARTRAVACGGGRTGALFCGGERGKAGGRGRCFVGRAREGR